MDSISTITASKSTHLDLDDQRIGIEGLSKLIQDENLENIEKLSLRNNDLDYDAVALISNHRTLKI